MASTNGGGGAVFETHARTSFLFDLDGTLVDSVYQHVLAWRAALSAEGIDLSVWRIHRKIGMSGGLFTSMLLRETGYHIDPERIERLRHLHAAAFNRDSANIQLLPGARQQSGRWMVDRLKGRKQAPAATGKFRGLLPEISDTGVGARCPMGSRPY